MDRWKYFDITHKRHLLCNPLSQQKFEELCRHFRLKRGAHVLDIACGKGEFLIRLAELYEIVGVGVDLSPSCIKDCLTKQRNRIPTAEIHFIEMDGADYTPESPESFDLSMCIGASWIYDGYSGTVQALKKMTKVDGLIAVGEPFWLKDPSEEYARALAMKKEDFRTHCENVKVGEEEGLSCLYTLVSNHDDWDHYETLQWWAVDDHMRAHPDDPDNHELVERSRIGKERYLRWGRNTMGWAIYVFRKH